MSKDRSVGRTMGAYRPLVSIIMATYRRPHTIFRTVAQIVAQTYPHWELIVVDNARTGDYHFDDPRIRVFRHAFRASASYARNQGIQHATGELLCFFDDDDDMFPTYLERFVGAFEENPEARMARCGIYRGGDGRVRFNYATPACCLRRELATPTWISTGQHDQRYFRDIIKANGWSAARGDIVRIPEILVRARSDPRGGLRKGRL